MLTWAEWLWVLARNLDHWGRGRLRRLRGDFWLEERRPRVLLSNILLLRVVQRVRDEIPCAVSLTPGNVDSYAPVMSSDEDWDECWAWVREDAGQTWRCVRWSLRRFGRSGDFYIGGVGDLLIGFQHGTEAIGLRIRRGLGGSGR